MIDKQFVFYLALIPGLITIGVARLISNMAGLNGIELTVFLLLASMVNVALSLGVLVGYLKAVRETMVLTRAFLHPFFVINLVFFSICNGVLLSLAFENDWVNRGVNALSGGSLELSKSSSHSTLHFLLRNIYDNTGAFPDHRQLDRQMDASGDLKSTRIMRIRTMQSGLTFVGYIGAWRTHERVKEIYLSPACRNSGGSDMPIGGAGVFVAVSQVAWIEFIDEDDDESATRPSASVSQACGSAPPILRAALTRLTVSCRWVKIDRDRPTIRLHPWVPDPSQAQDRQTNPRPELYQSTPCTQLRMPQLAHRYLCGNRNDQAHDTKTDPIPTILNEF